MEIIQQIRNSIYEIRGEKVLLDTSLAALYGVPGKVLRQAVKRNAGRFPSDFMFRLTPPEWEAVRLQEAVTGSTSSSGSAGRPQFVTRAVRSAAYLPYAFTEQGVAMLSSILHSDKAAGINIAIMRAFVEMRRLLQQDDLAAELLLIKQRLDEHDLQLLQVSDAVERLLDKKAAQRRWEQRERIGFKKGQ